MGNSVQFGPGADMVMKIETVGGRMADPLPAGCALIGQKSNALNKTGKYTTASDMPHIGLMVQEQLQGVVEPSEEALDFVDQLMHQKVPAQGA